MNELSEGPVMLSDMTLKFKEAFGVGGKRLEQLTRTAEAEGLIRKAKVGKQVQLSLANAPLSA